MELTETVEKFFPYNTLLGGEYIHRIELIQSVSILLNNPVCFVMAKDGVIRRSRKLDKSFTPLKYWSSWQQKRRTLEQLAIQIDTAHAHALYHGDLHPKNILYNEERVVVVDWEPSSMQVVNALATLKYTYPFAHPQDRREGRFTQLTDYLCLIRLITQKGYKQCLQICDEWTANPSERGADALIRYLERADCAALQCKELNLSPINSETDS